MIWHVQKNVLINNKIGDKSVKVWFIFSGVEAGKPCFHLLLWSKNLNNWSLSLKSFPVFPSLYESFYYKCDRNNVSVFNKNCVFLHLPFVWNKCCGKKWSKIILGQKKFGPKTIWGEKKCWDQKKLGGWKKICVKKIMDPNFLDPKFFTIYQIGRLISIVSKPIQRYWV